MKAMKCPECEEVSTFSVEWTESVFYSAPVSVDDDGDIQADYDNGHEDGSDIYGCDAEDCRCAKCNAQISIDEIEVVEVEEPVSVA